MKTLILVLCLLLTTNTFAASPTSAKSGPRAKRKASRAAAVKEAKTQLEALEAKAQELGINLRLNIEDIVKDMTPGIARKLRGQAKELEQALEAKRNELAKDNQLRVEVEVVLQSALDALSTRSDYAKAARTKEELRETDDFHNVKAVLGILNNALNIARAKVEDPESVSKEDMITIFQQITAIGAGAARIIAQARTVVESINNMGKTPLQIRTCK